ncbi:hypothetical protein V6C03_14120 [Methyloligella sp. 2.7D]|uniref:hypothetical protein n=1 Tax=unclassified Methyloligella TaxID=2625955 RepID=UPI00157C8961|nr:hypothetical protein [Methyloligella sp. GL2]QKP77108.1 hypothetical protein HT051_06345 [Methyloligella sp. GL2]
MRRLHPRQLKGWPDIRDETDPDAPDWDAIERAYEGSAEKLTDIAARFGISRQAIQGRARRKAWRRAPGIDPKSLARAEEASGAQRRRIVARLFQALDEKMSEIETRIARSKAEAAPQSAADSERDARALSALASLYSKLVELDEAAKPKGRGARGGAAQDDEAGRDADALREDLARRLRRFQQG